VDTAPWPRAECERRLREQRAGYHIHHPFNVMLSSGKASREQVRGWVANRFYYQVNIPIKDAAILANCGERAVRRHWVQRILDHDGYGDDPGGIESWLRLAVAVGLERTEVESFRRVLPGVRYAVDAYVNFARRAPWPEAVCASLTELFAPEIHRQRVAGWPQYYPWIDRRCTFRHLAATAVCPRVYKSDTWPRQTALIMPGSRVRVPPFPPIHPLARSFNHPGQHRRRLRMTSRFLSTCCADRLPHRGTRCLSDQIL